MTGGIRSTFDDIFTFTKVLSSSISSDSTGKAAGILYNVSGDASVDFSGSTPVAKLDDDSSEGDDSAEYFSSLGILSRPLPPETVNGVKYHAEALCIRSWDRMTPIGYRDTRLQMNGAGPKAGTVAMVGYGGGFLAFDPVLQSGVLKSSRAVLYCPYDFVGGTAQKAHAIILDTESGNESLSIIHSSGAAITMLDGNMVLKNKAGTATITIDDLGITMTGQINLVGSVVIGNPSAAVPLLAGAASPPCSTLFVSP